LLLGFHRRLASSTRALAASLERVAARLRRKVAGEETPEAEEEDARSVLDDLEGEDLEVAAEPVPLGPAGAEPGPAVNPRALGDELRRVEGFVQRARALGSDDGKLRALLKALDFAAGRARRGQGAGKLCIFTESLVTQEYLRDRLVESRLVTDE